MFTSRSFEFGHRALGQARPIGGARVERGHTTSLPSKDRFQLGDRCAVIGRPGRADLADAVGTLVHASQPARVAEEVTSLDQLLAGGRLSWRPDSTRSSHMTQSQVNEDRRRSGG